MFPAITKTCERESALLCPNTAVCAFENALRFTDGVIGSCLKDTLCSFPTLKMCF